MTPVEGRTLDAPHRPHDPATDAHDTLARAVELERLPREIAHETRRAFPTEALAVALADEHTGTLRLAHAEGYDEDGDALAARLASAWTSACTDAALVRRRDAGRTELSVALLDGHTPLGAITICLDADAPVPDDDADHTLESIAARASAALARARLVDRLARRQRTDAVASVAAAIATEMRNPLFGISSAAQLLRFRAREDPVLERNVGRVLREVERLNALAGDLLEFGAPRPLSLAPGDPDAVWDEILEGNRGVLESRALHVERTRPRHHARCAIDRERLAQLFLNILMNAVEAAPETSTLTLTSETVPSGGWRCALHNDGEPIPPDVLARAFDLFVSTKRGGTGIGLALARRIADEHHGTIALDSDSSGTTVTITLPAV